MKRGGNNKKDELVAVAIDKDKSSQHALRWAVDRLLSKGQILTLLHVKPIPAASSSSPSQSQVSFSLPSPTGTARSDSSEDSVKSNSEAKDFFLPFRCFCTRKNVQCNEVLLEEADITKALVNYVAHYSVDVLVLGAPSKSALVRRFKSTDIPITVSKGAPDFCTVYTIAKGKVSSVRQATGQPPAKPPTSSFSSVDESPRKPQYSFLSAGVPSRNHVQQQNSIPSPRPPSQQRAMSGSDSPGYRHQPPRYLENIMPPSNSMQGDFEIRSPFTRPGIRSSMNKGYEPSILDSDASSISSRGRSSVDRSFPPTWNSMDSSRYSNSSDTVSLSSSDYGFKSTDTFSHTGYSSSSLDSEIQSWASYSHNHDDVDAEMKKLKLEFKQTMDVYGTACKEAITAKQKAKELQRWRLEENHKLEEAQMAGEAAFILAEKESFKCNAALEAAEAAQKIAELECLKRASAEKMANREAETNNALVAFGHGEHKYRKYTIEEIESATENFSDALKIGEGGYGPVFRGELNHTSVAIKVLSADAAQGRSQFQQEVEVLSCIRHPNMVILLGACPEYGCLIYEYMANGSLEDCLARKGNTPVLSWQLRFRIASEIATGLLFLHQTKPEPLVHRDLKPANILLDHNYVSKISDVGLARLIPPSIANSVTQYRMTATAGTFCYIDPEYQQTGLLGLKSDIYSLGVMLLQMITSRPPIGLTHTVERSIENGNFAEILDPQVPDWPVEEALKFAKLSLQCAEMRRKDRPDLKTVVLPELNRLRALAEESITIPTSTSFCAVSSPLPNQGSSYHEVSNSYPIHSDFWSGSSYSQSSNTSSHSGRPPYWMD